jgi:predicted O-methyltransferase YrrM
MSNRTIRLDDALYDYLLANSLREPGVMRRLREETAGMPEHNMQIAPEQGQFMSLLVGILGARRCIEIGTFTGYSSLAIALAMPEDSLLIACDTSEEFTDVAKRYWEEAGVAERIELRLAPALETLDALLDDPDQTRDFDFAFVDADKTSYDTYYEHCLDLLKPGGVVAFDNTLWDGKVADDSQNDEDTQALRALNAKLYGDDRIELSLVPIGDGLTLCRKR